METNPVRVCELLVGLPDVDVLGVDDDDVGLLRVHVNARLGRPSCPGCGGEVWRKDRNPVVLVDLAAFGRPVRHKQRWECPDGDCLIGSFTAQAPRIAPPRAAMTDRAGRWVTEQVGRLGRSVSEVSRELGCDWHTVNDAVVAYGSVLVDDPDRIGPVTALGLDETLFFKEGPWHTQRWATSIVDVAASGGARLLDVVPGRTASGPSAWLAARPAPWRQAIRYGVLDLSGPHRKTFDDLLPNATQVVDPFHLIKLANQKLDECRRRVQNDTLGHRGRKNDPLYRARRLLTKAHERLDEAGDQRLVELLRAGDPYGDVTTPWHANQAHPSHLHHQRPCRRLRLRRPARRRPARRLPPSGGQLPGAYPATLACSDRRLAPGAGVERTHRSDQQPHQTGQTHRVRIPTVLQLPDPRPPLRRPIQLEAPPHPHPRGNPMSRFSEDQR